jgi:hypothetical protein
MSTSRQYVQTLHDVNTEELAKEIRELNSRDFRADVVVRTSDGAHKGADYIILFSTIKI